MTDFAIDGMAFEVLNMVRRERALQGWGDSAPGYDALARVAPYVSCLMYGHPDQPRRRLRRFRQQPWRCARCRTWWVTEHHTTYATWDSGGEWRWVRVEDMDASSIAPADQNGDDHA